MAKLPKRKHQTKRPTSLPKDFLTKVGELFHKQFSDHLKGSTFLVYGDLYGDEAVLAISLTHPKSLPAASLHISADLPKNVAENPEKVTEQLKVMVDVAASWFAQCFQSGEGLEAVLEEMTDSNPQWQGFDWEGHQLYVKLSRTNYTLEKAADDFLKKSGFNLEGEDILDDPTDSGDSEPNHSN